MTFLCLIFFALLLSGCAKSAPEIITPEIPSALLEPVAGPSLAGVATEGDLSDALVKYDAALRQANDKITAVAEIVAGW